MKKFLVSMLLIGLMFTMSTVGFAAGFQDAPKSNHWVYDNFQLLVKTGLLKGYPEGTFKGEQDATRYELVEVTGRLLKYLESKTDTTGFDGQKYLTKEEFEEILLDLIDREDLDLVYLILQNFEAALREDLKALDLKVTTLSDEVETLKANVATLQADVQSLKSNLASANDLNQSKDQQIAKVQKDAKSAKTLAIIGIATGVIGGILGALALTR